MGAPPTLRCTGSSRLRQLLKLLSLRRNRLLLINRTERLPFNCPSCTFTLSCRLYGALDCRELQCSLLLLGAAGGELPPRALSLPLIAEGGQVSSSAVLLFTSNHSSYALSS